MRSLAEGLIIVTISILSFGTASAKPVDAPVNISIYDADSNKAARISGFVHINDASSMYTKFQLRFKNGSPICDDFRITFHDYHNAAFSTKCGNKRYSGDINFYYSAADGIEKMLARFRSRIVSGKSYIEVSRNEGAARAPQPRPSAKKAKPTSGRRDSNNAIEFCTVCPDS